MTNENDEGQATRRGFLFGLLGGLAGALGLTAIAAKPEASSSGETAAGTPAAGPIDNIFVPLRSTKRKTDQE